MKTLKALLILTLAASAAAASPSRRRGVRAAAQGGAAETMTRERALKGLEGCSKQPRDADCGDWASDVLINAYRRGERDARSLKALLDAWRYSDGAMSADLGMFYAEMLEQQPRVFLRAIARRPPAERRELCAAAGGTDGSGMADETLREVLDGLRRIAAERRSRLAPVARACGAAVAEVNRPERRSR